MTPRDVGSSQMAKSSRHFAQRPLLQALIFCLEFYESFQEVIRSHGHSRA